MRSNTPRHRWRSSENCGTNLNRVGQLLLSCRQSGTTAYKPDNIDQHLYTWSAINLGNLIRHAGFEVKEVKRYAHRWPPKIALIDKLFGRTICNLACRCYAQ